jgi:hypothetical protein
MVVVVGRMVMISAVLGVVIGRSSIGVFQIGPVAENRTDRRA